MLIEAALFLSFVIVVGAIIVKAYSSVSTTLAIILLDVRPVGGRPAAITCTNLMPSVLPLRRDQVAVL
jgi:hypothetical protein